MQLTKHFSLEELIVSQTAVRMGIDNTPAPSLMPHLHALAEGLEAVREILGHPIHVTSGYRCAKLNTIVGGAADSRHMVGLAADILCPAYGLPLPVCVAIADGISNVDQVIHEFGRWCHVAFPAPGMTGRRQLLTISPSERRYLDGLLPV